jgi:hypothetical protein
MKVKITKTTDNGLYIENTITELSEKDANELIGAGYAEAWECTISKGHTFSDAGDPQDSERIESGKFKKTTKKSS